MNRIGLMIAAAMLGTTGVAPAGIALHQFTSRRSSPQALPPDAATQNLAANCWIAVGGSSASACNTGAGSASASGLPGLSDLDKATGLVDASDLVTTAKGLADQTAGQATGQATALAGTAGTTAA